MARITKGKTKISKGKSDFTAKIKSKTKVTNINKFAPVFAIISLIINTLLIPESSILRFHNINIFYFYLIAFLSSAWIFVTLQYYKTNSIQKISKLILLILATVLIINSLFQSSDSNNWYYDYYKTLGLFSVLFSGIITELGIILVYQFREDLIHNISLIFDPKDTNIDEKIIYIKGKFKTRINRNTITTALIVIFLVTVSIFTNFYRLDGYDLYSDEAQVTDKAAGYYYTGEYKAWSFIKEKTVGNVNKRGWPHIFIVAQSYKIFGITPWASRFPSALSGVLFVLISFFIMMFFLRDKTVAFYSAFSFSLYFNLLQLFRWSRMYAIAIPVFVLALYFGYRFITEKNKSAYLKIIENKRWGRYLNYNYILLPFFAIFTYFAYYLHVNTLFVLLLLYLISIYYFFYLKEPKYLTAILLGLLFLLLGYFIVPNVSGISHYLTFFTQKNRAYYSIMHFGYPFIQELNISLLIIGIAILLVVPNLKFRKVFLLFYIGTIMSWIVFSFLFNYPVSFRYMCFIAPLSVATIIFIYSILLKSLFNKTVIIVGFLMLTLSISVHFAKHYDKLYVQNPLSPAYPSIALKTMIEKFSPNELIYRHWGPGMYYKGIPKSAKQRELGGSIGKPFNEILDTLKKYPSGWLTWMSHDTYRLDKDFVDYTNLYFTKYHGYGIDQTGVELFHYTRSVLYELEKFEFERLLPNANINLQNSFSIAFWIKVNKSNQKGPFLFEKEGLPVLEIKQTEENPFVISCCYIENKALTLKTKEFTGSDWHHLCFTQNINQAGNTISLYLDGVLQGQGSLNSKGADIVKFHLNKNFVGEQNDVRIYNFALNQAQINEIIKNVNTNMTNELKVNSKPFNTLFHWKKN
jgi:hypothetical protein